GIRYLIVTGVQTCALPIFLRSNQVHSQDAPANSSFAEKLTRTTTPRTQWSSSSGSLPKMTLHSWIAVPSTRTCEVVIATISRAQDRKASCRERRERRGVVA